MKKIVKNAVPKNVERVKLGNSGLFAYTTSVDKSGENKGKFKGIAYDENNKVLAHISNTDMNQLMSDLKQTILFNDMFNRKSNLQKREKISHNLVKQAALTFNTKFSEEVIHEVGTAVRLIEENDICYIDVMTNSYHSENGVQDADGFKNLRDRQWDKNLKKQSTKLFGTTGDKPQYIESLGLEFHGVYMLEEKASPDADMFRRFKMDLCGYSDKNASYPVPCVTIAFWYKHDKN